MTAHDPPASEQPQRTLIDGRAALAQAVDAVLGRARRLVRAMDCDLAVFELSSTANVERLRALLLGNRGARVRLLVDDVRWLDAQAARLRRLQRDFPHALELRVASEADPVGDASFVLGDTHDALVLRSATYLQGELWLANDPHAQPRIAEFDRRWEQAGHNLPVSPLGL